jgi:hypothetical protein
VENLSLPVNFWLWFLTSLFDITIQEKMGTKRYFEETKPEGNNDSKNENNQSEEEEESESNDESEVEQEVTTRKVKTKKPLPPGYVCNACGKKDDHPIYECPLKIKKKGSEGASKKSEPRKETEDDDKSDMEDNEPEEKQEIAPWSLFVSGLPFDTNKNELLKFIKSSLNNDDFTLTTRSIILLNFPDNPSRCNGLGYINCSNEEEFQQCLSLNGLKYGKLALSIAPSTQPKKSAKKEKDNQNQSSLKKQKRDKNEKRCYRCGQAHDPKLCVNPRMCYRCRGTDHLSSECPQKKKV